MLLEGTNLCNTCMRIHVVLFCDEVKKRQSSREMIAELLFRDKMEEHSAYDAAMQEYVFKFRIFYFIQFDECNSYQFII